MRRTPFGRPDRTYYLDGRNRPPLGDPSEVAVFTVVEVGNDVLLCEDHEGVEVLVAVATPFRKSEYDGQELDGVTYAWVDLGERTAETEDSTVTQLLEPAYTVGERILAARMHRLVEVTVEEGEFEAVQAGEGQALSWEDLNVAGRRWAVPSGIYSAEVTAIGDNTLTCFLVGDVDEEPITVARPFGLRRTDYEGGDYTYVNAQERTHTEDETTEKVTPSYAVGNLILVTRPANGTGVNGVEWIDLNNSGRAWAEEVEE